MRVTDQCVWSLIHDYCTIGDETEVVARIFKKSLFDIESNMLRLSLLRASKLLKVYHFSM
jgi:hypothetical protein